MVDLETFPRICIWKCKGTELPGSSVEVHVEDYAANHSVDKGISI